MMDKLAGWKTHLSVVTALLWTVCYLKIPGAKEAIGLDNFGVVLAGLIGAAGFSMRSAVAAVHEDVKDAKAP